VWVGIAVFFFYTGVELTTGNWAFTIFTEARGIDAARAGLWVSLFWGSFALGRILFGFVQVKSLANLLRAVMLAALGGALLLAAGRADWMGLVGVIVIGVSVAPIFPLLVSETPARLGRAHAQHAIGFQVGAASLGIAVLPSIAGAIAESTSAAIIPWFVVVVSVILLLLHEVLVRMHRHPA
jgi:fucose permease